MALASAQRDGPAAGEADVRDRQRHLLSYASGLPTAPKENAPGIPGANSVTLESRNQMIMGDEPANWHFAHAISSR